MTTEIENYEYLKELAGTRDQPPLALAAGITPQTPALSGVLASTQQGSVLSVLESLMTQLKTQNASTLAGASTALAPMVNQALTKMGPTGFRKLPDEQKVALRASSATLNSGSATTPDEVAAAIEPLPAIGVDTGGIGQIISGAKQSESTLSGSIDAIKAMLHIPGFDISSVVGSVTALGTSMGLETQVFAPPTFPTIDSGVPGDSDRAKTVDQVASTVLANSAQITFVNPKEPKTAPWKSILGGSKGVF